jgi:hypothetical protein
MSSHAFHQTPCGHFRETSVWVKMELEIVELFNPAAQEYYRDEVLQQSTQELKRIKAWNLKLDSRPLDTARAGWRTTGYALRRRSGLRPKSQWEKTVAADFEAKPLETVAPVLRPNWRKPSPLVLRPNQWKLSEWFWGQTTHNCRPWF